jgi:hypothetical protein
VAGCVEPRLYHAGSDLSGKEYCPVLYQSARQPLPFFFKKSGTLHPEKALLTFKWIDFMEKIWILDKKGLTLPCLLSPAKKNFNGNSKGTGIPTLPMPDSE